MTLPAVSGEMRVAFDPELRFTPSGQAVANFRLVSNHRKKEGDEWVDAGACWLNGSLWGEAAENAVESITQGALVEVRGRLETREYEVEGAKKISVDLHLDSIAPSLRWATAKVTKTERREQGSSRPAASAPPPPPQDDEPPF